MRHELSSQNDPLDANLEKVLPSLHEWHRINKDEMMRLKQSVSSIDGNLCDIHSRLDSGFSDIKQSLKSTKVQMKQELAGTFLEIAKHLVRDAGGQLSDSTTLRDIVGPSIMTQDEPVGAVDPAQDTLETSRIAEDPADEVHQLFRLKPKHLNLLELVQEWYGTGDYYDSYGGVQGRNEKLGKAWRKLCQLNQMQYSRTERTVKAVEEYARLNSIDQYEAAERLQEEFEQCRCSVANFVTWAQGNDYLVTKKTRGKHKKATAYEDDESG
jgi:hypothetical protein